VSRVFKPLETASLSPLAEIRIITTRELGRSLRSTKGIALAALTLLGAFVASLISVWLEGTERTRANADSTQAYVELKRGLLVQATGDASLAAYLAGIPTSLLIFLKITVWFSPLLVALFGFDAVSGELQHRTVRFWTVRARRSSYFVAKLLGLWLLVGLVTLVLNLLAGSVALARGYVTVGELAAWGVRFWFVAFVIAGAWAAIATFISSCFKTPILALLTTFGAFFVLWIVSVGGFVARQRHAADAAASGPLSVPPSSSMAWYEYLYPNAYDTLLLSPQATRVLTAVGVLLTFVVAVAVGGSLLFQRRDV
jgi:ABC-type transport system involved in multi-copper enzyme maturation permease subunit